MLRDRLRPAAPKRAGAASYRTADLVLASELVRVLNDRNRRGELRPRFIVRGLKGLLLVVADLPRVQVRTTDSPAGHTIRRRLEERRWGLPKNRFAQGILILPESNTAYLRGRRMQAARTNVTRAKSLGIRCEGVAPENRAPAVESLVTSWRNDRHEPEAGFGWWRELLDREHDEWWCARDANGQLAALAVVTVDVETALLWVLLSVQQPARWLLSVFIAQRLCDAGVRHQLIRSKNIFRLDPALQEFQRRLGYTVAHLSLRESVAPARIRRRERAGSPP